MNRREALRFLGIGGIAGGASAGAVLAVSPVPADDADPILEAIARHRAVEDAIYTMSGDEPEWEDMLASEASAYEAVCHIVPTTLDGICRKVAHIAAVGVYGIPPNQMNVALTSLATAAATLGSAGR